MPENRLVVLCEPPSYFGLGSPFHFINFSSLGEDMGAAGISRASRTFNLSEGYGQPPWYVSADVNVNSQTRSLQAALFTAPPPPLLQTNG